MSLFLSSSLLILPDDDDIPMANAAAVDGPPMAALEAVSTSSQLDDGKFGVRACSACRSCRGSIIPRYVDDEDAAVPPPSLLLANSLPRLPKLIPPYVTNNVTTECTPNASKANSNADGPPIMTDEKLAVVPTEAKSR